MWTELNSLSDWKDAVQESENQRVLIFKHSTRCGVSRFVLKNLEAEFETMESPNFKMYFLDLLAHRDISNQIAMDTGIEHQSPQAIVLEKGIPIQYASHYEISLEDLKI